MEWISVKDSIPELKDDNVLAHFTTGSIETIHIEDWFKDIGSGMSNNGKMIYKKWYQCANPSITHWMPLPEPPKD